MRGCSGQGRQHYTGENVFPAYAGMFLAMTPMFRPLVCFPRVCGDVPTFPLDAFLRTAFSPRMRGCSALKTIPEHPLSVFPAYAGMFLRGSSHQHPTSSFPRVCGDVPRPGCGVVEFSQFSPRMRGCSARKENYAHHRHRFPRVCGDVPMCKTMFPGQYLFSPRMRGCSWRHAKKQGGSTVFPAYAGMFRKWRNILDRIGSFPRVCGDVPVKKTMT